MAQNWDFKPKTEYEKYLKDTRKVNPKHHISLDPIWLISPPGRIHYEYSPFRKTILTGTVGLQIFKSFLPSKYVWNPDDPYSSLDLFTSSIQSYGFGIARNISHGNMAHGRNLGILYQTAIYTIRDDNNNNKVYTRFSENAIFLRYFRTFLYGKRFTLTPEYWLGIGNTGNFPKELGVMWFSSVGIPWDENKKPDTWKPAYWFTVRVGMFL